MSSPFSLTTDSTCPFKVCNSLSLQNVTNYFFNTSARGVSTQKDYIKNKLCLPCNLSTTFGLLCDLRKLPVTILFIEKVSCFRWLKTMQSPLCSSPLCLSLFFPIVFLCSKCSLLLTAQEQTNQKAFNQVKRCQLNIRFLFGAIILGQNSPCFPRDYPKPFR